MLFTQLKTGIAFVRFTLSLSLSLSLFLSPPSLSFSLILAAITSIPYDGFLDRAQNQILYIRNQGSPIKRIKFIESSDPSQLSC
jgi:hypothetical protein